MQVFGFSCLFGAVLGLYYDVFRLVRLITAPSKRAVFFYDVFYLFSCGIFTFLFCFAVHYGEVRFYILAGETIGWCLYHLTLGELFIRVSAFFVGIFRRFFSFIGRHTTLPLTRFCKKQYSRLCTFQKKRHEKGCQKRKQKRLKRQGENDKSKKSKTKSKISLKQHGDIVYNQKRHSTSFISHKKHGMAKRK